MVSKNKSKYMVGKGRAMEDVVGSRLGRRMAQGQSRLTSPMWAGQGLFLCQCLRHGWRVFVFLLGNWSRIDSFARNICKGFLLDA